MKKKYKEDDGHTVYDMSNVTNQKISVNKKDNIYVSKKETKAIIKAAFETYFPRILMVILGFGLSILLIYFWLN